MCVVTPMWVLPVVLCCQYQIIIRNFNVHSQQV